MIELITTLPQVYGKAIDNKMVVSSELYLPDSEDINDWTLYSDYETAVAELSKIIMTNEEFNINALTLIGVESKQSDEIDYTKIASPVGIELVPIATKIDHMKKLTLRTEDESELHKLALEINPSNVYDFDDIIGNSVKKNALISCDGVVYMVMQDTTLQAHFRPSSQGMLAMFQPHQGNGIYPWLYGEYCTIGMLRTVGDDMYEATQDPNTNIYSPELVPAIWTKL